MCQYTSQYRLLDCIFSGRQLPRSIVAHIRKTTARRPGRCSKACLCRPGHPLGPDRFLLSWLPVEDVLGRLIYFIGVITAPIDEFVKKGPKRLLWIRNDLVVFHLFQ